MEHTDVGLQVGKGIGICVSYSRSTVGHVFLHRNDIQADSSNNVSQRNDIQATIFCSNHHVG